MLDYRDIVVTNHNKYSMVEIQELATGILMTGGLQAPLESAGYPGSIGSYRDTGGIQLSGS